PRRAGTRNRAAVRSWCPFVLSAEQDDLGAELADVEQMADAAALPGGGGELRGLAAAALQLALDGGGALLPAGRRLRHVLGVRYGQHLQARAAEQHVEVGAGREVVALRRIVQLRRDGQVDEQADPAARAYHA